MKFFEKPIVNSPYQYPNSHWQLSNGLPTQKVSHSRRRGRSWLRRFPGRSAQIYYYSVKLEHNCRLSITDYPSFFSHVPTRKLFDLCPIILFKFGEYDDKYYKTQSDFLSNFLLSLWKLTLFMGLDYLRGDFLWLHKVNLFYLRLCPSQNATQSHEI